jgi:glycosyltransferase involved in cell wall biosynthesis
MKEVNFVASVSESCRLDFLTVFPTFQNRIAHLPIGVNDVAAVPYTSLKEIGITDSGPFLLHVAGFMPEKNHAGLLRIFQEVLQHVPQIKLLLIGEGKLKASIEKQVNDMNLNDSVIFLGKRNDVQQIMGACDVFVLPSLIEGLPGVILEAFLNRLPVIAYDTGGIKEVVITGKTGWLVSQQQEAEFAQAVLTCLKTKQTTVIEQAFSFVQNKYTLSRVSEDFSQAYRQASK